MDARLGNPLVSAIITTRDRPSFLSQAVQSVVAQTYRPLQLIIVDDGSKVPVTREAIDVPDDISINILHSERSTGVSAARNRGVREAGGKYVAFLDDDEQWLPEKIAKQVKCLMDSAGPLGGCGCQVTFFDGAGAFLSRPRRRSRREEIIANLIYADENITPSALLIDRQSFLASGGYREDMPFAEDREFLLRFLLHHDFKVVPEWLVDITEHKGSRLTRNHELAFLGESQFLDFVSRNKDAFNLGRRALGYRHARLGHQAMLARRWRTGLWHFFTGVLQYPFDKRIFGGGLLSLLGPDVYRRLIVLRIERLR